MSENTFALIVLILIWIMFLYFVYKTAIKKRKNPFWFILGSIFLGPLGLVIMIVYLNRLPRIEIDVSEDTKGV